MELPESIINKIMLYNSHKTADVMRLFNRLYEEKLDMMGANKPLADYDEEDIHYYWDMQESLPTRCKYVKTFNWLLKNWCPRCKSSLCYLRTKKCL